MYLDDVVSGQAGALEFAVVIVTVVCVLWLAVCVVVRIESKRRRCNPMRWWLLYGQGYGHISTEQVDLDTLHDGVWEHDNYGDLEVKTTFNELQHAADSL